MESSVGSRPSSSDIQSGLKTIKTAHIDHPVDDSSYEPSLLDLPEEVRQMIFKYIFARKRITCLEHFHFGPRLMPHWSLAILQTSQVIYVEAMRALRFTIAGLELTYLRCLPPGPRYEQEAGSGPDNNYWRRQMDRHINFLRQHGGIITKVRSEGTSPRDASFNFNLLPNLKTFSMSSNLMLVASKQELGYTAGTINKASLLRCFIAWCSPLGGGAMISPELFKLIEARKGVERAFSVYVDVLLGVDRVVPFYKLTICYDEGLVYKTKTMEEHPDFV